jgi:hypothetical protein
MQFFQEITNLSAKLYLDQSDICHLENQNLESDDFDLNFFLEKNFVLDKESNLLNYSRLEECFPNIEKMQKKICEEIAVSVDSNLDKYIEMAEKFENIKTPLQEFDEIFEQIKDNINSNKEKAQKNSEEIEKIIASHDYIKKYTNELKSLKFCISNLKKITRAIEQGNLDSFNILNIAKKMQNNNEKIETISISKSDFINCLTKKYNIKKINEKIEEKVLATLEKNLQLILSSQIVLNANELEKVISFTQAFNLLGKSNKGFLFKKNI